MNPYQSTPEPQKPADNPPQQPAPPAPWQPVPASYLGQPQYGSPPPAPQAYEYPQQAAPPSPPQYGQNGQYAPPSQPMAQAPYGQYAPPNAYSPPQPGAPYTPPGQPPQPYPQAQYPQSAPPPYQTPGYSSPAKGNAQRNRMIVIGVGVLLVALVAFFVIRSGSSSLTGTWVGNATAASSLSTTTATDGVILVLTESSGGQVSGTAQSCSRGSTSNTYPVTGSRSGSDVTITISGETYKGTVSGGKLSLSASVSAASVSMTLHHGSTSDFQSLCKNLPTTGA